MDESIRHTFTKQERLCGKTGIDRLLAKGKRGYAGCLRFCWLENSDGACSRIMVSVPKKFFKRAVKRNLLKRRIRESWRMHKHLISEGNVDIMISYSTKEIMDYAAIDLAVGQIVGRIGKALSASARKEEVADGAE
ncbi:MAG: ribonuclease P protein component [Candidatus Cryptobacteroides sp.]